MTGDELEQHLRIMMHHQVQNKGWLHILMFGALVVLEDEKEMRRLEEEDNLTFAVLIAVFMLIMDDL